MFTTQEGKKSRLQRREGSTVRPCASAHPPDANRKEAIVYPPQDIGTVRGELVHRALAGQRVRLAHSRGSAAVDQNLRELLDQAHARIRFLEQAIRRLTTAL
jgi:hypothetical protein